MELKDLIKQYQSIKPNKELLDKGRTEILNYIKENPIERKSSFNFYLSLKPAMASLMVLVFIFFSGYGTIYAARNTVPGNFLYPVKRLSEKTRMALLFNQSKKTVLRAEILTNRLQEVQILAEKVAQGDKESEPKLSLLTKNFNQDLSTLKKEVVAQNPEDKEPTNKEIGNKGLKNKETGNKEENKIISDKELLSLEKGHSLNTDLPVQDKWKVLNVSQAKDLKKILDETKELLTKKDLKAAVEKINDAEKITNILPEKTEESNATSTPSIIPSSTTSTKILPTPVEDSSTSTKKIIPISGSLEKISPTKIKPIEKDSQKSDFNTDGQKGGKVSAEIIRTK